MLSWQSLYFVFANSRVAPRTPSGEALRLFSTQQSRSPASRTLLPSRLSLRSRDRCLFSRFLLPFQSPRDSAPLSCLYTPRFSPSTVSSSFPRFDFALLGSPSSPFRTSPPNRPASPRVPFPAVSSRSRALTMHLLLCFVQVRTRTTAPLSREASRSPLRAALFPSPTPLKPFPTHLSSFAPPNAPCPQIRTTSAYRFRTFPLISSTLHLASSVPLRSSSSLSPSPFVER